MGELGDMDLETHTIQIRLNSRLNGLTGKMYGEFSKSTNKPDGRCIFVSSDEIFLIYLENGSTLVNSPEWRIDRSTSTSIITCFGTTAEGVNFARRATICPDGQAYTEFLVEGEMVLMADGVGNSVLDAFFVNRYSYSGLKVCYFSREHY